jgi:diguanylate cyclase (GGDEF)-like protein/PAS domain S-box-containing protein
MRIFWKNRDLCYLGCNPAFAKDAGENDTQSVIGKNDYQLAWKEQAKQYQADDWQVMDSGNPKLFFEEHQTTSEGKTLWLRTSKVPLNNQANETIGILGIYEDVTEQKLAEERIHYLANFDPLTGLPNRSQLNDHLKYALSLAKRSNGHLALMFLDLDHFKDINDTLGHSIGDILLIELAKRLCLGLREEDTITRLGGDEFILLLPGVDALGAINVAEKLLNEIARTYRIEHYDLTLTASIGIALYPEDGDDLEALSKSADTAMYRAKQEGRQCYRFFTPEMQAQSKRNLLLLNALHHALEHQQLYLHYQPQIAMKDGRIIGAEALLRWQHPEFGNVTPAEFIPIAESSGLILPIGEWVLRCAIRQAKIWIDDGFTPLLMAVNLSSVQFRHPDLPELITRILNEEGLPPEYLELELTEGEAMHNPQAAIIVINELHKRGIRMSIDDFGTGYSSLSYLKKFKVYKLKIDQSFIRDINTDSEDKAIVSAIIHMAKSLGLQTIAEGVENLPQQDFLREQGCDEMQGYLFSKPLTVEQFEALLMQQVVLEVEN